MKPTSWVWLFTAAAVGLAPAAVLSQPAGALRSPAAGSTTTRATSGATLTDGARRSSDAVSAAQKAPPPATLPPVGLPPDSPLQGFSPPTITAPAPGTPGSRSTSAQGTDTVASPITRTQRSDVNPGIPSAQRSSVQSPQASGRAPDPLAMPPGLEQRKNIPFSNGFKVPSSPALERQTPDALAIGAKQRGNDTRIDVAPPSDPTSRSSSVQTPIGSPAPQVPIPPGLGSVDNPFGSLGKKPPKPPATPSSRSKTVQAPVTSSDPPPPPPPPAAR